MSNIPLDEPQPAEVVLTTMPTYFAGLPMFISITVRNIQTDVLYMGLPIVEWFGNPLDARWLIQTPHGEVLEAGLAEFDPTDEDGAIFDLGIGEQRTMLVDLAAIQPNLEPGLHTVQIEYPADPKAKSVPARLDVADVMGLDADIAAAVRTGTAGGSWANFFGADWCWQEKPPIERASAAIQGALGLHLFLHRAFYGDHPVPRLDISGLDGLVGEPVEAEAAVLRHEILHAAGQPAAQEWKEFVVKRWPGLAWRLDKSEQGFGFLQLKREAMQERLAYRGTLEIDLALRP